MDFKIKQKAWKKYHSWDESKRPEQYILTYIIYIYKNIHTHV